MLLASAQVCTWKDRSKSRACVFWVLLILCYQRFILQTASSSRMGSQQLSPFSAHVVQLQSGISGISCLSFHMTSFYTSWSKACWQSAWSLPSDFSWGWTRWSCGWRRPAVKCVFYSSVFSLAGCTRVSRGTFKLHFNPPLLISAVNYRTVANKSSLGYDGT